MSLQLYDKNYSSIHSTHFPVQAVQQARRREAEEQVEEV